MPIQGLRDTSGFVADQRPKNWREAVLLLYPNGKAPLTALTNLMKSKSTDDPEFNWWEKSFPTQRVALSADIDSSQTTITLTEGAKNFRAGHVLRVEQSEELLKVVMDPASDTSLVVQRGFAGSTPASVNYDGAGVNPNLHAVGNVNEEGSLPPTGINYDPTKRYNYTQIMRNTLEMTRTASKTRLRTGDQVKEARRECLELHSIEMEKAFLFGKRYEGTQNGKPVRMTSGFINWIDSGNVVSNGGTAVTMATLEGWLERMFRYGSSEKLAFAGNLALLAIQQAVRKNSHVQIMSGIKEFGMNVSRLICPFGELVIKTHPLFNQITGGTTTAARYYGLNSWLLVLDQQELVYRHLDDTTYQKKLEANGLDGMQSGYLTEAGLEVHHPLSHFLIKGMETGALDA
jgi:hypothetical protein